MDIEITVKTAIKVEYKGNINFDKFPKKLQWKLRFAFNKVAAQSILRLWLLF